MTQRPKEAQDYLRTAENLLEKYSALVIVSGDGLLFEVIQGLFQRPDWQAVIKDLPIAIIPGGTGNGLAKTLAHLNGEEFNCLNSCLNIIKAEPKPMDLVRITNGTTLYYSFLSIGWGFTSDTDIESEIFRFMGEARFFLYSLKLLLELRSYRAVLTYRPRFSQDLVEDRDDFVIVYCVKQPWVTSSLLVAPEATLDDGVLWLLLVRRRCMTRLKMLKVMMGFADGAYLNIEGVELIPVTYFKLAPISQGSYLTVDGEVVENGTIEAEIIPKAISIFSK